MVLWFKRTKQLVLVKGEKKEKYVTRMYSPGLVSTDTLVETVQKASTYSRSEVEGILGVLRDEIKHLIESGHSIKLDSIGVLRPTFTSKAVDTIKECNAYSIKDVHLRFRPNKELIQILKDALIRCFHDGRDTTGDYFEDGTLVLVEKNKQKDENKD